MIVNPAGENRGFHRHRPGLRECLHITVFFSYVVGAALLSLVSAAVDFGVGVLRRDARVYSGGRGFSQLLEWRKLATEFIGSKFVPPLYGVSQAEFDRKRQENERKKNEAKDDEERYRLWIEFSKFVSRPSAGIVDVNWGTWYSVLDDYFRQKNETGFVDQYIPVLHASGWAAILACSLASRHIHWAFWTGSVACAICGFVLHFISVFLHPRTTDTTAQMAEMLKEIRSERNRQLAKGDEEPAQPPTPSVDTK
jgi:hypothetical protein